MLGFAMTELQGLAMSAQAGECASWEAERVRLTMKASLCGYVKTQRGSVDGRRRAA